MNELLLDDLIRSALKEDIGFGDVTTDSLIGREQVSDCRMGAKENGIIAGLSVVERVFRILDPEIAFETEFADGQAVNSGDVIARIHGNTRAILKGERVALNLFSHMCGIATQTSRLYKLAGRDDIFITDTRKTLPGLRMLDKYAVTQGGGRNHRLNLSDLVLIKDNHIAAVGSISEAVARARKSAPFCTKVEVEVETLAQLSEALAAGADIIMLDNMSCETMKAAVSAARGRSLLEASGNVDESNIASVAATGVDIISSGSLTHSVKAFDISLKFA